MSSRPLVAVSGTLAVGLRDDFHKRIAEATRVIRRSVPALSKAEQWFLDDILKGRYIEGWFRLMTIAQRCASPVDAAFVTEQLRGFILSGHPSLDLRVFDAFRFEQRTNGDSDLAQIEFMIAPSPTTRDRAIEALFSQEVATRAAIDALHRDPTSTRTLSLVRQSAPVWGGEAA